VFSQSSGRNLLHHLAVLVSSQFSRLGEKADVDPSVIRYWEDLLDAVQRCKAAGVIPIAVGGSEKWALQFYPAFLMMRVLGKDGMASAYQGDNGGFAGPDVVKPGSCTKSFVIWIPSKRAFTQ
jgi:raffinose/stachyose/melibiose transport system substrate-binding protein